MTCLYKCAKNAVHCNCRRRRHIENSKLALQTVRNVIFAAARHVHGCYKPDGHDKILRTCIL